jgi:hypothetical protein
MPVKFMTKKTYLENVNGSKKFKEFNINYDSMRDKKKQIRASFNSNGKKYEVENSLQKFMNNMRHSPNSIFDLLKTDLRESKKNGIENRNMNFKNDNVNGTRKNYKGKYRVSSGITSKLFSYDMGVLPRDHKQVKKQTRRLHNKINK